MAIHIEKGAQNQQKINQNMNTTAQLVNANNDFQRHNRNANNQQSRRDFTRYSTVPQKYQYDSICSKCGELWGHNHRQICPVNAKKGNSCGITGHFARKCWEPKNHRFRHLNLLKRMWIRWMQFLKKWRWRICQLHYQSVTTLWSSLRLQLRKWFRWICSRHFLWLSKSTLTSQCTN